METSLTGEDQLYQRATKLIDCHVNIAVTWSKQVKYIILSVTVDVPDRAWHWLCARWSGRIFEVVGPVRASQRFYIFYFFYFFLIFLFFFIFIFLFYFLGLHRGPQIWQAMSPGDQALIQDQISTSPRQAPEPWTHRAVIAPILLLILLIILSLRATMNPIYYCKS